MREKTSNPAGLMGHPARWAMLVALRDSAALPMSMLASAAGVAPSTASEHLTKLTDRGLLRSMRRGRRCYFELAGARVAHAIDAPRELTPADPVPTDPPHPPHLPHSLHTARTCYDHLGGSIAVAVTSSLLHGGVLTSDDDRLTERGSRLLDDFGVRVEPSRRQLVGYCKDWPEQRRHLGRTLGAALLSRFTELRWVEPHSRIARAVDITDAGRRGFAVAFGIDTSRLRRPVAA